VFADQIHSRDSGRSGLRRKGERAFAAAARAMPDWGRATAFSGGDLPEAPGGGWLFFS
jgi:hypothetical protein